MDPSGIAGAAFVWGMDIQWMVMEGGGLGN